MLIAVGIAVVVFVLFLVAGYVKSPPDTAYIISGFRKTRILIGKAGIRIPFLERLDKLSLKMFSVDVKTTMSDEDTNGCLRCHRRGVRQRCSLRL